MVASAIPARADEGRLARWQDALTAGQLFAIDPAGLGGIALLASPGAVRDLWLDGLRDVLARGAPMRRLPARIEDDRLLGGVDLVATLRVGRPVLQNGILAEADGGVVLIPMAERLSAGVAARLAAVLDRRELTLERDGIARRVPTRIGIVAFDEGESAEERLPGALLERFAFHVDLRNMSARGLDHRSIDAAASAAGRSRLASVERAPDEILEALVATASAFGIASVTAPLLALRTARAAAALAGRSRIDTDDAVLAARLVLGPRARVALEDETEDDDGPPDDASEQPPRSDSSTAPADRDDATPDPSAEIPSLEDIMLASVRAALPEGLLASMKTGTGERRPSSRRPGAGATQATLLRGRPVGVRGGTLRSGARLALVETLRAAAPWQPVRRAAAPERRVPRRIEVRAEDFRIKKFEERREATIVFCVDASGSTAFHRLAEAKGAVELLLAEAYVARTYAALVVFRGKGADLLLPPTRSLSRAKSLLANLPGGGGTPLAAGIDAAVSTACSERAKGREPLVVMLTDGRANIGRDGLAGRPRAMEEALAAARRSCLQRIAAVFVDTSPRPRGEAAELAAAMGARYVALPYVEASSVRDVVLAAVPAPRLAARRSR